jgi:hypothetical protein
MGEPDKPPSIKFHYIKSNFFRTVRCDGVVGGLNSQGDLIVNVYSERSPIPRSVVHELSPDMSLGPEMGRKVRDGVVREVEISFSMNLQMAKSMRDWIDKCVIEAEEIKKKYDIMRSTSKGDSQQPN